MDMASIVSHGILKSEVWHIPARSFARGLTGLKPKCHLGVTSSGDSTGERMASNHLHAVGKIHFHRPI